jgi:hypothetical protein
MILNLDSEIPKKIGENQMEWSVIVMVYTIIGKNLSTTETQLPANFVTAIKGF